jgi:predicted MFS family arabinose efflux permease
MNMELATNLPFLNSITWLLASFFYAFQMVLRVLPIIMIDFLSRKVGLSAASVGLLAGIYYIGYCLAHIPVGICLDKYKPKNVIILSILLCIAGIYLTSFAETIEEILISRFIIGIGSAAGFLGAARVVLEFYPKKFGLMLGLTVTIGFVGALWGAKPISNLLTSLSPLHALQAMALFGMILIGAIFAFYVSKDGSSGSGVSPIEKFKTAILDKRLLLLGLFGGLMVAPLEGFAGIWGIKYLQHIRTMSREESEFCINILLIGAALGFPFVGYFTNKFDLRKMIISLGIANAILISILLSNLILTRDTIYVLCFAIGFLTTHEIAIFTMLTRIIDKDRISISIAIVNMIIMSFGFIYHATIGYIIEIFFTSSGIDLFLYSTLAYQASFSVIVIGILLGVIGFWRVKI